MATGTIEKTDAVAAIGLNAGAIWRALSRKSPQTITQLRQESKLPEARIREAIGWLAREGKLAISEAKGQTQIALSSAS